MSNNQEDLFLLHNNPEKMLLKYQVVISIIVQINLIDKGFFHSQEKEELIQMVNEALWGRMENIRKKYNGKASVKTYVSKVILNICREIKRKRKSDPGFDSLENKNYKTPSRGLNPEEELAFRDEYSRFEKILITYYTKRSKIELCLKLIYRIAVFLSDFSNYCYKFWPNPFMMKLRRSYPMESLLLKRKFIKL
ncbi:MAG: hypothetical protein R2764_03385 [Bacteroidales bacterium]